MSNHRGVLHHAKTLHFMVVAFCTLLCISPRGPCTMTEVQNPAGHDKCRSYRNDLNSGSDDALAGDNRRTFLPQTSMLKLSLANVFRQLESFRLPSTLSCLFSNFHRAEANGSGFSGVESDETLFVGSRRQTNNFSSSSNSGSFKLLRGRAVSCSLEIKGCICDTCYCRIDNMDQSEVASCRGASMDWRVDQREDSVIINSSVEDAPFSIQVQISSPSLDWGEKHLYFRLLAFWTVENKHYCSDLGVYRASSTNIQFCPCNSIEEMQHVKEQTAWISVSSDTSFSIKCTCSVEYSEGSSEFSFIGVKVWLNVTSGQRGQPKMGVRADRLWEAGFNSKETVSELESSYHYNGEPFFFMLLETKASEMVKDESITGNWRSQRTKNGMSLLEDDEVLFPIVHVHIHGRTFLGSIIFDPSSQCSWKSSAPVKNHLSGVECLSLRGFRGPLSLLLFEWSDLVLYAKNAGVLTLKVNRIEVSITECGFNGFVAHTCKEISASMLWRDLELAMACGLLVIPMKASLPTSMLTICKRSLMWSKVKKFFIAILVAGLLIFVMCSCVVSFISQIKGEKWSITHAKHEEHETSIHYVRAPETANEAATSSSSLLPKSVVVEESQSSNLAVKIAKEKRRRRKKKRSSGARLPGQVEASSSHSSNSTPSSPMSPASSSTTNRLSSNVHEHAGTKNPFKNVTDSVRQKNASDPKANVKYESKSLVLPTKEKPCAIAPYARAPGSEWCQRRAVKADEKSGIMGKFEYDIWGDHLGLCFKDMSNDLFVMNPIAEDSCYQSLFARGPESLLKISQAKIVSSKQDG